MLGISTKSNLGSSFSDSIVSLDIPVRLEWGGFNSEAVVGFEIPVVPVLSAEVSRVETLVEQRRQVMIDFLLKGL